MINRICGKRSILLLILVLGWQAPLHAQEVDILIEYVKVPEAEKQAYRQLQETQMRRYHQDLFDAKRIYAWYDYEVRFPRGAAADYNHVVVTVMAEKAVRAERDQAIGYKPYIVSKEIYQPVYDLRSPDYGSLVAPFSSINFWHAEPSKTAEVHDYIRATFKPDFDKRVANQEWLTWSAFKRVVPAEADRPYNHVIVTRHPNFAEVEHPLPFATERSGQVRPRVPVLVKSELWMLHTIIL